MTDFQKRLQSLLNEESQERYSNTPDFVLASYLSSCLDAFNSAVTRRDLWYGVEHRPSEVWRKEPGHDR